MNGWDNGWYEKVTVSIFFISSQEQKYKYYNISTYNVHNSYFWTRNVCELVHTFGNEIMLHLCIKTTVCENIYS